MTIWSPKWTTSKVPETPETQVSFTNIWGCEIATKKQNQPPRKTINIPWLFRKKQHLQVCDTLQMLLVSSLNESNFLSAWRLVLGMPILLFCSAALAQYLSTLSSNLEKCWRWRGDQLGGGNSNIFGIFTPKPGEMVQFDDHIFSNGLKPPTSQRGIPDWFRTICKVC